LRFSETRRRMKEAEEVLSPWVIRHLKPKLLSAPFAGNLRRLRKTGASIDPDVENGDGVGLPISGEAILPFLLSSRAVSCSPETRPVFSEGLSSSYEAFLHTRKQREKAKEQSDPALFSVTDQDDTPTGIVTVDAPMRWYLEQIEKALPLETTQGSIAHPKIGATVKRVMDLWRQGEKVLVFCHYVATGRTLRQCISAAMISEIENLAAKKLKCSVEEAKKEMLWIGDQISDIKSPHRADFDKHFSGLIEGFPGLKGQQENLVDVIRKMLRAPSFLVRFFPFDGRKLGDDISLKTITAMLTTRDGSGMTFQDIMRDFLTFLIDRCETVERESYIEALLRTQTGSHVGADVASSLGEDEIQGAKRELLIANVRLANGDSRDDTRHRLMLTFNTPFFPDVLIASSIMAEGVDLHLNCRHVIHHDLCWNPSTLEQRTGRVDRIGAKVERCGMPVNIFLPYISETQDEKMFRVVMDRERWFQIVMGEKFKVDVSTTDKLAERIPLPESAAQELIFRLEVGNGALK
jgi:hypothetical protein